MKVAEYVSAQIDICGRSQKEIAEEVGFPKANILTMIKHGSTKIPIPRAAALAKAMGVDQTRFVQMVMKEYQPEIWAAIEGSLGKPLSDDEAELIELLRAKSTTPFDRKKRKHVEAAEAFAESLD